MKACGVMLAFVACIQICPGSENQGNFDFVIKHLGLLKNTFEISEVIVLNEISPEIAIELYTKCQQSSLGVRFLGNKAAGNIQAWLDDNHKNGGSDRLIIVSHSIDINLTNSEVSSFQWLILNDIEDNTWIFNSLSLESKVYIHQCSSSQHQVHELYAIGSKPIMSFLFQIHEQSEDYYKKIPLLYIWKRRSDLRGITLLNGLLNTTSHYNFGYLNVTSTIGYSSGYFAETILMMQKLLNFTSQWVMPEAEDTVYGGTDVNGSWTGIVGMLERQEIDLSSASLTVAYSRRDVMDFSLPIFITKVGPVMRKWRKRELNVLAYINTFLLDAWLGLASLSMVCVGLLTATYKLNFKQNGLLAALAFVYCALLQKGFDITCRCTSSRVLYLTVFLLTITVFAYYSAVMTSLMTLHPEKPAINSFEDILNSNYKVYLTQNSQTEEFFKTADNSSTLAKLYTKIKTNQETFDKWLVDMVKDGLKDDEIFLSDAAHVNFNDYIFLDIKGLPSESLAFGFVKDSEFTELFSYNILKLQELGFFHKLYQKLLGHEVNEKEEMVSYPLDYNNVMFPFTVLALSCICSCIAILIERMVYSRTKGI